MSIGEQLKKLRVSRNWTKKEVSQKIGIPYTTYNNYETGAREPGSDMLLLFSNFYNVSVDWILGQSDDIDTERLIRSFKASKELEVVDVVTGARKIPVLDRIKAGEPAYAQVDINEWILLSPELSNNGGEYVALKVDGSSMSPKYEDGDLVVVRVQPDCENGQDAVVFVNGDEDSVLKKIVKRPDGIILQPLNPAYEPKFYDYGEVRIYGIVVEMRRRY